MRSSLLPRLLTTSPSVMTPTKITLALPPLLPFLVLFSLFPLLLIQHHKPKMLLFHYSAVSATLAILLPSILVDIRKHSKVVV